MIRTLLVAIVAALSPLLLVGAARADVVKMKDGREFVGVIVEEQSRSIKIDTLISNIRTQVTLQRREIASIERSELPKDFFSGGGAKERAASRPAREPTPERPAPVSRPMRTEELKYLEIPIVGVFGEDIIPVGVSEALQQARRRGVSHIVFRIDSGGGQVWAADDIAKILDEHDDEFTYHALIQHAGSAAIWVALSCDTITMTPGSSIGAAVVFTKDETTGAAEVDAKLNSAIAAQLAARAERKGHNPVLVRAMVLAEAEAYGWKEDDGPWQFAPERPKSANPSSLRTIDTRDTVLTLTASEALDFGFARFSESADLDALGEPLGVGAWRSGGLMGANEMQRARDKARPIFEKFDLLVDQVMLSIQTAIESDPNRGTYYIDQYGNLADSSRRDWQRNTDAALRAWRRVQAGLIEIEKLEREREKLAMSRWVGTVDLKSIYDQVSANVRRLEANRNRQ